MNILFVFPDFTPFHGGVQMVTDILSKEFIKRGHKVTLLSQDAKYKQEDTIVPVISIDLSSSEYNVEDYYKGLLRDRGIDIIINQLPLDPQNDFFLKHSLPNIKTISVYHSKPFGVLKLIRNEIKLSTSLYNRVKTLLYYIKTAIVIYYRFIKVTKGSDVLCLLSPYYKAGLVKVIPYLPINNIEAIGNPLAESRILEMTIRKKQIIFVGRLDDKCKNLVGALDVWNIFVKKYPDWRFVIIGDDSGIDNIKQVIIERNIPNVEFVGRKSNMVQYYAESSFILQTSFYEGWSMAICEAMSYGCVPCVYKTYESLLDFIQDGESGLICPPFDPQAMADRLDETLSLPERFDLISKTAIERIEKFKVHSVVSQWEELFNKLKK